MKSLGRSVLVVLAVVALSAGAWAPAQAAPGKVIRIKGIHTIHTHAQADRYLNDLAPAPQPVSLLTALATAAPATR